MTAAAKFPPSVSATAALIAGAVVIASHDPALHPLVPAGAAELSRRLLAAAGRPGWVRATRVKVIRAALRQTERLVLSGILRHYLVRKLALQAAVLGACSEVNGGCQQVVVLGAGLDTSAPWVDGWLRRRGEPFRWAAFEDEMRAMLARHGWTVREFLRAAELRERFLRPVGLGNATLSEGEDYQPPIINSIGATCTNSEPTARTTTPKLTGRVAPSTPGAKASSSFTSPGPR